MAKTNTTPPYAGAQLAAQRELSRIRRAAGESSVQTFGQAYLPAHFKDPPSRMHQEMFQILERIAREEGRGERVAVAAPRGHAKSTIVSLSYALWCICYNLEHYILLISNTAEQANDFLSFIKAELTGNPRLAMDFPEVVEPPGPSRWRKDEIITRNGVKITALGAEKKVRGRRHNQHRPTLIILDDIENEQEVRSPDQRRTKMDWLQRSVLKAGSSITNVVVVGTILHFDSLLANLINPAKSPGWTTRKYQAVESWSIRPELWQRWESIYCHLEEDDGYTGPAAADAYLEANRAAMLEGTKVLWPEREDYPRLMEIRVREGRASFDSEKQNEPVNPEDCYFRDSDFVFWDDQFQSEDELLASLGEHAVVYGACDPSLGKLGKGRDDTAIITLVKHSETGVLYVLDADIRRRKPDSIIEDVIAMHARRRYELFGFETNQFQQFLADELRRRSRAQGVEVPVRDLNHTTDKLGRIQKLQPFVTSGGIRLCRRHIALLDQLRQFPMAAHDDGPDCLEMAVATATGGQFFFCLAGGDEAAPQSDDDDRWWTPVSEMYGTIAGARHRFPLHGRRWG